MMNLRLWLYYVTARYWNLLGIPALWAGALWFITWGLNLRDAWMLSFVALWFGMVAWGHLAHIYLERAAKHNEFAYWHHKNFGRPPET